MLKEKIKTNTIATLEKILSSLLKDDLINYIKSHSQQIGELIQLATSNNPPHSSRAAYLLSKIANENVKIIQPHVSAIINILPSVEDGQQRDLINVLREINLDEEEEGRLYDACVLIWSDVNKIPSVRFIAFRFILDVCKKYPELKNELNLLTENHYLEPLSDGIKRAIFKRINNFRRELK